MSHLLTCFHKRHSPLNNLVQVLYYPVIGIHAPYQTRYGGLQLCLQYTSNLLILSLVLLDLGILGLVKEQFHHIWPNLESVVEFLK